MEGAGGYYYPTGDLNAKSLLLPTIDRSLETAASIWSPGDRGNCIKRAQLLLPKMKAFIKHKMVCEGILSRAQCDSVCRLEPGTHNYVIWVLHERGMWEDESRIIPPYPANVFCLPSQAMCEHSNALLALSCITTCRNTFQTLQCIFVHRCKAMESSIASIAMPFLFLHHSKVG